MGNYEIDHVTKPGADALDMAGVIGIGAGYLWPRFGVATGGERQMLLDQIARGTASAPANRSAPGLSSLGLMC